MASKNTSTKAAKTAGRGTTAEQAAKGLSVPSRNTPPKTAKKTTAKRAAKAVAKSAVKTASDIAARTATKRAAKSAPDAVTTGTSKPLRFNAVGSPKRTGTAEPGSAAKKISPASSGKSAPVKAIPPSEPPAQSPSAKPATKSGRSTSLREASVTEPASLAGGAPADLVDEQLAKYRSMRDFSVTAEPAGETQPAPVKATRPATATRSKAPNAGLPFVIQKHAASHLHYDFRLGWSGVLKSWAVAKGPSYVVADKRLAVQVEDHPMEYGGFEGIIPKGQYGGGTVMVWDQGTWWPQLGHENVEAGLRTGSLKFEMHGSKMRGKWTLIRMHTTKPYGGADGRWRSGGENTKPQWLLIKEHDEFERPAGSEPLTEAEPNSALTGRTMEEIARESDHVWNSKETAGSGQAWYRQEVANDAHAEPGSVSTPQGGASLPKTQAPGRNADAGVRSTAVHPAAPSEGEPTAKGQVLRIAPRRAANTSTPSLSTRPASLQDALEELPVEPQPEFIQPQLAQEAENPPEGAGWLHELKLDGYRMQARKSARGVQMLTRSGLDWTYRVQGVADAVAALPFQTGTLDGEVVVLAEDGTTNFANLQASFQNNEKHPLTFFCFDLLHLEGRNTRQLPLRERKALLAQVIPAAEQAEDPVVRLSEHLETSGSAMFKQACELHAEGIISKRADEPYQNGRRASWLKSKCLHEQEFVIGGFSPSSDGPDRIGSLLLGYYGQPNSPQKDKLIFAGRSGTGFTQKQRKQLREQLTPLEQKAAPFLQVPADQRRDALWVRPELVAQVRFATWTAEDLLRQAAFLGLREDKAPAEVFREEPTKPPIPKTNERKQTASLGRSPGGQDPSPSGHRDLQQRQNSAQAPTEVHNNEPVREAAPATLRLTHPRKVLDPASGLTKQQLADYYWAVAQRMLPHIADRPLSLVRCPDGAGKPCFYQKHVNHMLPPGIGSVMVADKKGGKLEPYITLNSPEALAGLAQMGVLEVHPWGSQNSNLECPDRLVFDLDPDEALAWSTVAEAAMEVRARLKKLGLESFLKTTGGKGLHIVAPIVPEHDFATTKDAAHRFVSAMERANPRLYLTKMTKAARIGKIYLDYLRNERGATAVAPFSPRARTGVPASVTLDWKELANPDRPSFPVAEFPAWQERLRRDPWRRLPTLQQSLDLNLLRSL